MGDAATTLPRRASLVALLALALTACAVEPGQGRIGGWDFKRDDPELWRGYHAQGIYQLQQDVFLLDVPDRTNGLALVPGMNSEVPPGTLRGPTGIEEYHAEPHRWLRVTGVVTAGTRLRAEVLRGKGNLRDPEGTVHYVRGRLLDGEFRGQVVDLQALSLYAADPDPKSHHVTLTGPNEDFLLFIP
mgnify:CR=1 FL=1